MTDDEGSFDPDCFFAKRDYKLSAPVGRDNAVSFPRSTVLDTGARPDLIHKRLVDPAWPSYIRPIQSSRLLDASKRVIRSCDLIYLTVGIGEFRARVSFLVVQSLPVDCLLGRSLIDYHVKAIVPELRKIVFYHSLSLCPHHRSTLPCQAENIPHP